MYDYLVVGAVFAHEAVLKGKKVKVIEKNHIAGNIYTREEEGIQVHQYGAHIFHTSDKEIDYVNQFAEFNRYTNSPVANYKGEIYNLPFNMNTFNKLWGVVTPAEAQAKIDEQRAILNGKTPENLEEQAISLVGTDIYEKLIKDYTEKQWGKPTTELPSFIIRRLPVHLTYDNNYFNDTYQGIPIGGYNVIIENMLKDVEVELGVNFFANRQELEASAEKVVFTGMIDQSFDYKHGELEYCSLRFDHEVLDEENYQGNAVVNYMDAETPYTRIIEHKHFEFGGVKQRLSLLIEHSKTWEKGDEPYYPVNNDRNNHLYKSYKKLADEQGNVIFGGRLGHYRYYDMHQVIGAALQCVRNELDSYSMKIKEQTRKLAVGCSKHCFEVADGS
uniref:UDP-galactopyranose mutase Glf n=1 Tax=Streptococcus pneumoniae TaxID=1313 RepID=Q4K119_STREE|nr:UDP-galactopyranose mutase Glf [Streptococcus pneumoniae]